MPFDGTQNTVADTLRAARALIEDPAHWIKGDLWCGDTYCSVGAVLIASRSCSSSNEEASVAILNTLIKRRGRYSMEAFNDDPITTHADIMAVFDEAIASVEAGS